MLYVSLRHEVGLGSCSSLPVDRGWASGIERHNCALWSSNSEFLMYIKSLVLWSCHRYV